MRYWFYRWIMIFAHRHGWHKMDECYPNGDTMLWCHWCGLRVVTKRHLTTGAVDGGDSPTKIALPTPQQSTIKRVLSKLTHRH